MAKMNEIYAKVAEQLKSRMESGNLQQWQKEYVQRRGAQSGSSVFPISLSTGKNYSGINFGTLFFAQLENNFNSTTWGTFKQYQAKGGCVRKGQHGTNIIFFSFIYLDGSGKKISEKAIKAGASYAKKIAFAREYTVFNLDQVDGLEAAPVIEVTEEPTEEEGTSAAAELAISNWTEREGVKLHHHDGRETPYYAAAPDLIAMPARDLYSDINNYYKTYFHEAAHSTGHRSRLNRDSMSQNRNGDNEKRCIEEVTAEVSSLFIATALGIAMPSQDENTASYVGHWKGNAEDSDKAWYMGLKQAQAATTYFMEAIQ